MHNERPDPDFSVTVELEIIDINQRRKRATVATNVVNQDGKTVVKGQAEVMPAIDKVVVDEYPLPEVLLRPAH